MRKFEYKYVVDEKKKVVVALSSFAGQTIRGVARCSDKDTFNIETGKKLAAARCSVKIAEKRMKRAEMCSSMASDALKFWTQREVQMKNYEVESVVAYQEAVEALAKIEKTV